MGIQDWLKGKMRHEIDEMLKSDGDKLVNKPEKHHDANDQIGQKAMLSDPYFDQVNQSVIYKHRASRLSNKTLKDVSIRDWLVSAIVQARTDTLLRFSRPSHDKFEMGFRVVKRDETKDVTKEEREEIKNLESFIYRCGRMKGTPQDDSMLFGEFLKKSTRDALTFGHVGTEKIKTKGGGLHRFRPLPAESVYLINKKTSKKTVESALRSGHAKYRLGSDNDPRKEQEINEEELAYYKYVQVSLDQTPLAVFGDEDMIFKLFNPQNFMDSMGYCYSPLELAIVNVTNHLNAESYNANFFTHGQAARGILHLKGTVTQGQLTAFRRQFYNTINGAHHAWKTPIVAGLDEINWVPMAGNARDMEYINFNNHIMRAICTQFQIDPVELGLDFLTSPTGRAPMQQANNSYKIEYSRERGLYPLLMFFEDMVNNDIIPAIDIEMAKKYKFEFIGYSDETPQTQVAQLQAEMTVHSSLNDVLRAAQKEPLKLPGCDLPLNQAFWALMEKNMTRGEIREHFFGDKDASKKRELQYIPADPAHIAWQQLLLTVDRQKKQDAVMEQQMQQQEQIQQQQMEYANAAHSREQQQHDAMLEDRDRSTAHHAVAGRKELKETAKDVGAASKAINIEGQNMPNPINAVDDE